VTKSKTNKKNEALNPKDHRSIGQKLDLFTFSDLVGPGLPLLTPKGTIIYNLLDDFVWQLRKKYGYQKVEIPHITKKDLYKVSGHWDKFKDELFKIKSREGCLFALKPMNCPHHTQIYARKPHSYRELPIRYANTTACYRDEQSGELLGISRTRAFTQDDAHIFCRKNQIEKEFNNVWNIVDQFYANFGFKLQVRLSLHDPKNKKKYLGDSKIWQETEQILRQISRKRKINAQEAPGEAAFYGPKIDFITLDSQKREWQIATIQLDMNLPQRFNLNCINKQGKPEPIFMIHAAITGAIERFMSILIEHFTGAFPVWLSPIQVAILPISDKFINYANQIKNKLERKSIRTGLDDNNDSLGKKIRNAENQKTPYILILGQKEQDQNTLSVRQRGKNSSGQMTFTAFFAKINKEINNKTIF